MATQDEPFGNTETGFLPCKTGSQTPPESNRRIPESPFQTSRYCQADNLYRSLEQKRTAGKR